MAEEMKKENPVPEEELDETAGAPEQETAGEAVETPETEEAPEAAEEEASEPRAKGFFGKGKKEPKKDQGQLLAEAADKYLRLAAEYDNYRKRTAKEKETLYQDAKADTIREFLSVYDNLERAAAAPGGEDDPHKKGLEMIFTQYKELLKKLGVSEIEAQGRPFDPERHEAVMHVDDEKFGENEVAQVFQAGFALGDKVIRHAVVQVAN